MGNDLSLNASGPVFVAINETYLNSVGNIPNTTPIVLQGGVLVGAEAADGIPVYGAINVCKQILKRTTQITITLKHNGPYRARCNFNLV
ncbi:hypothetical protein D3C74_256690 [compost metagenome]